MTIEAKQPTVYCSFCGKSQHEVRKLIGATSSVFICEECIELCLVILHQENIVITVPPTMAAANALFEAVKHGDDAHQSWLKGALAAWFSGKPVTPVRGSGIVETPA